MVANFEAFFLRFLRASDWIAKTLDRVPKVPLQSKGGTTLGIPPLPHIVPTPQDTSKSSLTALVSASEVDRKPLQIWAKSPFRK